VTPASTLPTVRETSILARRSGSPLIARREVAEIAGNWPGRQWLSRDAESRYRGTGTRSSKVWKAVVTLGRELGGLLVGADRVACETRTCRGPSCGAYVSRAEVQARYSSITLRDTMRRDLAIFDTQAVVVHGSSFLAHLRANTPDPSTSCSPARPLFRTSFTRM
jgi:hypothetical protein